MNCPNKVLFLFSKEIACIFFPSQNLTDSQSSQPSSQDAAILPPSAGRFVLRPHQFDVLLLVDVSEVAGGSVGGKKSKKDETIKELKANNVRNTPAMYTRFF